jgi:hypothetical protein
LPDFFARNPASQNYTSENLWELVEICSIAADFLGNALPNGDRQSNQEHKPEAQFGLLSGKLDLYSAS